LAANNLLHPVFLFDNTNQEESPFFLDDFYKVIMTREFGQVLFEANVKATETKKIIEELIIENTNLCESIKKVL
jgi:hypothetical protein